MRINESGNERGSFDVHTIDSQPTVQIRHVRSHVHDAVTRHEDVANSQVFWSKYVRVSNQGKHDGSNSRQMGDWQDRP